jgi:hypothetical protein
MQPAVIFLGLFSISKNNSELQCFHAIYRTLSDIQHFLTPTFLLLLINNAKKIARNRYFVTYVIDG